MLRRVENQCRVKDSEAERREDLNEEQHSRSLRSCGETALEEFHPATISPAASDYVKPATVRSTGSPRLITPVRHRTFSENVTRLSLVRINAALGCSAWV